jgi:hypothetical protein
MEILHLLWPRRWPLANTPQLVIPLNYRAISSSSPLQNSTHCICCPGCNFLARTTYKTPFLYCCVRGLCRGNVFKSRLLRIYCPSNGRCFATVTQQRVYTLQYILNGLKRKFISESYDFNHPPPRNNPGGAYGNYVVFRIITQ